MSTRTINELRSDGQFSASAEALFVRVRKSAFGSLVRLSPPALDGALRDAYLGVFYVA